MTTDITTVEIAETTGKDVALAFSFSDADGVNTEGLDGMVRDLRRLPYNPVEMVWERELKRGKVVESCLFVDSFWRKNLRRDFLLLAPRHGMDAVVSWSVDDGITVFFETPNGRDYVAWDVRRGFDLQTCRDVVWDRLGPRFTEIGDTTSNRLREVRRFDSKLSFPVRYTTVGRAHLELSGEFRY